jgi:hypothetical protein
MMRVKKKTPPTSKMWMGLGCLKVTKKLAHEYAAGVGWVAAVEGEQQIQSWEAKDINLRATAWACAGENICDAISVAIVDANTNATGKVFCVGHELGK